MSSFSVSQRVNGCKTCAESTGDRAGSGTCSWSQKNHHSYSVCCSFLEGTTDSLTHIPGLPSVGLAGRVSALGIRFQLCHHQRQNSTQLVCGSLAKFSPTMRETGA